MHNIEKLIAHSPYINHLGAQFELIDGQIIIKLPYKSDLIGNPMVPAIHGGVIAATMELAASVQFMHEMGLEKPPKTINVAIDYLRSGRPQDVYAKAIIFKHGRRVANIEAFAWQDDETRPIAKLHGNLLLKE